ncbi:nitrogenase component 1 [Oceanibaculum nanhaiense]|uniref:nitrogenase component 1 n=1 Tax=Oceanibaculum nanhaiense TaxID=1909734 RepID=UPI003D27387E
MPAATRCTARSRPPWPTIRSRAGSRCRAMKGPSCWSAACWSKLGADLRYVGTACPKTKYDTADAEWLAAHGVDVRFRASLEQDIAAFEEFRPDLAIGTTPVVQKAKEAAIPALYFTNLISARPLMGPAGVASLPSVINAAIANKARFDAMHAFFEGVGSGDTAGIWEDVPENKESYRKKYAARTKQSRNAVDSGESVGC